MDVESLRAIQDVGRQLKIAASALCRFRIERTDGRREGQWFRRAPFTALVIDHERVASLINRRDGPVHHSIEQALRHLVFRTFVENAETNASDEQLDVVSPPVSRLPVVGTLHKPFARQLDLLNGN